MPGKKLQSKNKIVATAVGTAAAPAVAVDGQSSRDRDTSNSIGSRNSKANGARDEWKSTMIQRKKLMNSTNAAAQQQCKTKATGPTSPTEATIAPIYYNGNSMDSKNGAHFHPLFNQIIFHSFINEPFFFCLFVCCIKVLNII